MHLCKVRCRGVILDQGQLLVVKHSGGRDFYALPGGHLDRGESPLECMERELVEELGILPEVGKLLYVYSFMNDDHVQSVEFFFEIINASDYRSHENEVRTHAHEIDEILWITPEDSINLLPKNLPNIFGNSHFTPEQYSFSRTRPNLMTGCLE